MRRIMTKAELLEKLKSWHGETDHEGAHIAADEILLEYINDEEIAKAFNDIEKWYS
jgi:hypothetical protein